MLVLMFFLVFFLVFFFVYLYHVYSTAQLTTLSTCFPNKGNKEKKIIMVSTSAIQSSSPHPYARHVTPIWLPPPWQQYHPTCFFSILNYQFHLVGLGRSQVVKSCYIHKHLNSLCALSRLHSLCALSRG